jgi:branched-subunit amino acid aminotransferase/4-amino-4-deoxychorismate lyase
MMELDGQPITAEELGALALVNYGHFTTMRIDDGRVRGLTWHLDRLVRDCRVVFGARLDPDRVWSLAARAAAGANDEAGTRSMIMRITVFDPYLSLGHPAGPSDPRVLITVRPVTTGPLPPLRLRSVRYARDLPEVKHTGLFGALHQRRAAQSAGFDDALFVGDDGAVSEGPTWNIGVFEDGVVTWPAAERLRGVTMRLLDAALVRLGVATRTAPVALTDLSGAGTAFITNAAVGPRPVRGVDGVDLAEAAAFHEALREEYDAIEGDPIDPRG